MARSNAPAGRLLETSLGWPCDALHNIVTFTFSTESERDNIVEVGSVEK